MKATFILWMISFITFWGYATWYVIAHGVPTSWSDTFYRLQEFSGKKNMGYILTGVLWVMAMAMIPITVEKHPFMFLVLCLIMFIGAAPAFKSSSLENFVHMFGSIGSVLVSIVAFALLYQWYILATTLLLFVALTYKGTTIKNPTTWIESVVIFSGHIIILFKDVL